MRSVTQSEAALLQRSASDPGLALLDGFHAVKHALRFNAEVLLVVTTEATKLHELVQQHAPDLAAELGIHARVIERADLTRLAIRPDSNWTEVWGVARRPLYDLSSIADSQRPIVLLEQPKNRSNLGACIRVAAAAGAGGVVIVGSASPWDPPAVRGAVGLQFAIPVINVADYAALDTLAVPIVAVHPDGDDLSSAMTTDRVLFAFGSERAGLSDDVLRRATRRVRIPMEPGVSSLNLSVAVGVTLYTWRAAVGR